MAEAERKYPLPERLRCDTNYTLPKPQLCYFEDFVDNSEELPFIPKMHPSRRRSLFSLGSATLADCHPYQHEVDQLNLERFRENLALVRCLLAQTHTPSS